MADREFRRIGSLVVFDLAGRLCALPAGAVQEVVLMPLLARPPGLPAVIEGVMNLGGTAVPVVRLDRLFGLAERAPGLYTPVLVLRDTPPPLALMVHRIREIRPVAGDQMMPAEDKDSFNACVMAAVRIGDDLAHVLSPRRILLEQERQRLAQFQEWAQQRLAELEAAAW